WSKERSTPTRETTLTSWRRNLSANTTMPWNQKRQEIYFAKNWSGCAVNLKPGARNPKRALTLTMLWKKNLKAQEAKTRSNSALRFPGKVRKYWKLIMCVNPLTDKTSLTIFLMFSKSQTELV